MVKSYQIDIEMSTNNSRLFVFVCGGHFGEMEGYILGEHNKIIGSRVREVYLRHNMTQADLAEALGYSDPNMISMIVNGRRSLTPEKALKMVELFPEVKLGWLFGHEDAALREAAMQSVIWNDPEKRLERHYRAVNDLAELAGYPMVSMGGERFMLIGQGEYTDITFDDYERLCDAVLDYVEAKAGQLLRRKALENQNPAPGADTPGAGAGQKVDGPLPSQYITVDEEWEWEPEGEV